MCLLGLQPSYQVWTTEGAPGYARQVVRLVVGTLEVGQEGFVDLICLVPLEGLRGFFEGAPSEE